jgi:hypothetical protein
MDELFIFLSQPSCKTTYSSAYIVRLLFYHSKLTSVRLLIYRPATLSCETTYLSLQVLRLSLIPCSKFNSVRLLIHHPSVSLRDHLFIALSPTVYLVVNCVLMES